jgi:hypothetical protein
MKTLIISVLFLFLVSCGKNADGKTGCMTRNQILTMCIAEGINLRPNPMQLDSVKIDCNRQYPVEQCFAKQDAYFPYNY